MLIQERLQIVLKMHNLTPSAFADQIGVQRSALSHVLTGRNKPGLDFLEKILTHFPRVNAHWLITGVAPGDHDQEENNKGKKTTAIAVKQEGSGERKEIVRIACFYSDGSFDVHYPDAKLEEQIH
jgi:transcriptional regulator with XRE-family HTH domain